MARKCGRCRQEGHTIRTCTEASDVQHRAETRAMDAAIVASHKPATRTCACGEITTMGAFPGRHEAEQCGESATDRWPVPDPFSSPAKAKKDDGPGPWFYASYDSECGTCDGAICEGDLIRDDGSGGYECENCGHEDAHPDESPVTDHRKWCTRCKLLGHYSADCTTAVLSGGMVSVPVSPGVGMVSVPVVGPVPASGRCDGCMTVHAGECDEDAKPQHLYTDSTGVQWAHPGERDECGLPECQPEPDPFSTPTQAPEKLNVSGQPSPRYEWYGKQNRGYLVKLPDTGDFRRHKNGKPKGLTRATTFNKAATDQNSLTDWAKRNVLIGASKRPDLVAKAHGLTHEDNRDQLMKLVAELETTAGAKVSADVGTLIHELTERWDAGQLKLTDVPPMYVSLIHLYDETLKAAGLHPVPGLIERTTYIPEFGGVVGTLDRVYYHEPSGRYVIGDVKTGKTLEYGMDEIETQEWIYAHGVNNAGVYDWNEDEWEAPEMAVTAHHGAKSDRLTVSEEWGVVVHMPVQGDDAGKVTLVRADLQRGRRHAEVCHDVRVQRANKPKPEPWTGEELKTPEMPAETDWAVCFSLVENRDQAATWWQKAYDAGVSPEEMARLKEIADARLAELTDKAFTPWEEDFRSVVTVADAGQLWEDARKAGVEPLELNRLVGLAQQRLRELGISG